jgi:hypothetical protein
MTARRAVLLLPIVVALVLVGAGCGGEAEHPIAFVGDTAITREQLGAGIEQLRADRRRKGEVEEFPEPGSPGYRRLRDSVLGLLVFRAELQHSADRLGIAVDDDEVEQLIEAGGGAPGEDEPGSLGREASAFARDSIRAQLLYQRIYERITHEISAPTPAARSARRREEMSRFVARMRREARVRYKPGYAPGS